MEVPRSGDRPDERATRVVELVGDDLFVCDEWGEYYDPDDFVARDHLADMAIGLAAAAEDDDTDPLQRIRQSREIERIKRIAEGMNRLQAYTYLAESDPDYSVLSRRQVGFMRDICDFLEFDAGTRAGGFSAIPTGVGKTVLFNELIHATGLRALVVADSKEQVRQNHDKLFEHARGRDIDAGIVDGDHKKLGKDATYTTYASLLMEVRKRPDQRLIRPEDYDVLIVDEAHLVLGENRRRILDHFGHAIRMGFTATDKYTDEKQVSIVLPNEMSRMSLIEAEDAKLVAPHHNILVETSTDMRHVPVASTGDYAQDILFESINTDARNLVAVETYVQLHYGKKVIDFCGGIEHAKDLAEMYVDHGIPAAAVWGAMPDEDRRKIFADFRAGKIMHITNADLVTTGFDMKSVECVYMLQPSLSLLRTMQIGGRSNRLWGQLLEKVSYVVQFIDDHYSQPPVIFAEQDAAGTAQHGWDGFVFPAIDVGNLPYRVIHDPLDVELVAAEHHEGRQKRTAPPPENWATFAQLSELSGRPKNHIDKAYKLFLQEQEKARERLASEGVEPERELLDESDHSGLYLNPKVDGGRKRYYSPTVIERLAEHLEQYEVKPSTMWRHPTEIAEIYGRSTGWVNQGVLWGVRGKPEMEEYEAEFVQGPDSIRKTIHFHYELLKAGFEQRKRAGKLNPADLNPADLIHPPDRMMHEDDFRAELDEAYGEGAYELAFSRRVNRHQQMGWGNRAGSIAYEVDGEISQYYTPKARSSLRRELSPASNKTPLVELLERTVLGTLGFTEDDIFGEVEEILGKDPTLRWKVGLYANTARKRLEYYGEREVHAHIYERLYRKHQAAKLSEKRIQEGLEASPALRKDYIPEPEEPDHDQERKDHMVDKVIDALGKGHITVEQALIIGEALLGHNPTGLDLTEWLEDDDENVTPSDVSSFDEPTSTEPAPQPEPKSKPEPPARTRLVEKPAKKTSTQPAQPSTTTKDAQEIAARAHELMQRYQKMKKD